MMTMTSSSTSSLSSLSATMKKQQQKKKKKKNLAFPSIKDTNRYHRRRGGEISVAACATQPRGRGEEAGAEKREINTNNKNDNCVSYVSVYLCGNLCVVVYLCVVVFYVW